MASHIRELVEAWTSAPPAEAIVPLSAQPQYALLLALIALALSAVFILSDKKSLVGTVRSFVIGVLASLAFGFGAVFLINSVNVYV